MLSQKQKALLDIAINYGMVHINQIALVYSDKKRGANALKRLVSLGYLKPHPEKHGLFLLT